MAVTPFPARPWTQAAIDMFDLESALPIARMAVECGVDWLEVGTPLIYGEGFAAIRALKDIAGARSVVVDYKARDNCHMLFSEARKHGGDFATVSASGNDFGVIEALRARADCGIGVLADLYGLDTHEIPPRAMELAAMGVDGILHPFRQRPGRLRPPPPAVRRDARSQAGGAGRAGQLLGRHAAERDRRVQAGRRLGVLRRRSRQQRRAGEIRTAPQLRRDRPRIPTALRQALAGGFSAGLPRPAVSYSQRKLRGSARWKNPWPLRTMRR